MKRKIIVVSKSEHIFERQKMERELSKTKNVECQVLANGMLMYKEPSHSTGPPRKASGIEGVCV